MIVIRSVGTANRDLDEFARQMRDQMNRSLRVREMVRFKREPEIDLGMEMAFFTMAEHLVWMLL